MLVYQGKSTYVVLFFQAEARNNMGNLDNPIEAKTGNPQDTNMDWWCQPIPIIPHPLRTNGETWGGSLWLKLLIVTSCSRSSDASIPSSANCVHRNGVCSQTPTVALWAEVHRSQAKKKTWCFTIRKRDHCRFVWSCLMVYHGSSSLSLLYVKHILRWIINW